MNEIDLYMAKGFLQSPLVDSREIIGTANERVNAYDMLRIEAVYNEMPKFNDGYMEGQVDVRSGGLGNQDIRSNQPIMTTRIFADNYYNNYNPNSPRGNQLKQLSALLVKKRSPKKYRRKKSVKDLPPPHTSYLLLPMKPSVTIASIDTFADYQKRKSEGDIQLPTKGTFYKRDQLRSKSMDVASFGGITATPARPVISESVKGKLASEIPPHAKCIDIRKPCITPVPVKLMKPITKKAIDCDGNIELISRSISIDTADSIDTPPDEHIAPVDLKETYKYDDNKYDDIKYDDIKYEKYPDYKDSEDKLSDDKLSDSQLKVLLEDFAPDFDQLELFTENSSFGEFNQSPFDDIPFENFTQTALGDDDTFRFNEFIFDN